MLVNDHQPPHFHAIYGEFEANIDIATGKVIKGKLPKAAKRLVKEWADLHRVELMDNWLRREQGEPFERIPGLDAD
jgi:hypothetical protein